jgi:hypothetical protein
MRRKQGRRGELGKKRPMHALREKLQAFTRDVSNYPRGSVSWKGAMREFKRACAKSVGK